ncbi:hypothetical protein BGZ96_004069 [Linnemannia gamsii]|uniref:XPG-I domain-containing protein n=1 Tax=Linnemannia gamsii TaxID=64522 RepID=A0ABQ7JII0_9FUNG|nr:hypothetical protein BGZ96_004069 [Linnemannia gamsii]
MTLYIDGGQAEEKINTAKTRDAARQKALDKTEGSLNVFETRLNGGKRIKKRHFTDVKAGFKSAFYWSLPSRQEYANYMRHLGWTVVVARTEADLAIALDAGETDIIISKDSDMLAYQSVKTLWRPTSNNLILVYKIPDILATLGISRTQLTALAVVSKNDYHGNIYSLGPATNFSIIKEIGPRPDAREIISAYLAHGQVLVKNTKEERFHNSIRVYVLLQQNRVEPLFQESQARQLFRGLQDRFRELCAKHKSSKTTRAAGAKERSDNDVERLPSPKTDNRYRTVESPKFVSQLKITATSSPQPAPNPGPSQQSSSNLNADGHPPLARTRIPRNRGRFSFKERTRKIVHGPPANAKQFKLKFYRKPAQTESIPAKKSKPRGDKATSALQKKPLADLDKNGLVRRMNWHHPSSSLEIGTVRANVGRAVMDKVTSKDILGVMQQEVVDCLQEAPRLAGGVKREAQRLIGHFVESLKERMDKVEEERRQILELMTPPQTMTEAYRLQCRKDSITEVEREILLWICESVKPADIDKDEEDSGKKDDDNSDVASRQDKAFRFLLSFLTYLYSGNFPKENSKAGGVVDHLVIWLVKGGIHNPARSREELGETAKFTPGYLVRSVSGQMAAEFKRMYGHGTRDLHDKLKAMKDKGIVRGDADVQIQPDISAVENFLYLNKLTGNSRRFIPMTSSQQPFMSFSEREIAAFFWKRKVLKDKLVQLGKLDKTTITSVNDLDTWISGKEPGFVIKNFIADVAPQGLTSRQRKRAGHRSAVKLWSLDQIRSHLADITNDWLDPLTYAEKGYILRGSIKTDGFRIQLLGFKLRELQDVRFRRIGEDRLPSKLTSTVGGTDYYLPEIRHVITCEEDVARLWPGVRPEAIKSLTLDGGKAFVVGAFADIPDESTRIGKGKDIDKGSSAMEGNPDLPTASSTSSTNPSVPLPSSTSDQQSTASPTVSSRTVFRNLAVKQKAIYQPTFRFRRWLEGEKMKPLDMGEGEETISEIETGLPPLKGEGASVINYSAELKRVEEKLLEFYGGRDNLYKRHKWDMERARQYEYQLLADRLLGVVGGSIGCRYDPANPVVIGVGLGKFSIKSGLSSLDSTFLSFFIQKARSLGYLVVGLNEYYTSKKCPCCGLFVAQVTLRRFFCPNCHVYHHRDVMAGENMSNIVRGYLEKQQRPEYLQPVAPDGTLPWMASTATGSSAPSNTTSGSGGSGSTSTTSRLTGRRKRPVSASSGAADGTQHRSKRSAAASSSSPAPGARK